MRNHNSPEHTRIIDYLYSPFRSAKVVAVTGLMAIIITALAGCSGWVPTIGNYPLGPNKAKNKAIAEYECERQGIDISKQRRYNLMMGKEPYDDIMIPLLGVRRNSKEDY